MLYLILSGVALHRKVGDTNICPEKQKKKKKKKKKNHSGVKTQDRVLRIGGLIIYICNALLKTYRVMFNL